MDRGQKKVFEDKTNSVKIKTQNKIRQFEFWLYEGEKKKKNSFSDKPGIVLGRVSLPFFRSEKFVLREMFGR